MLSLLYREYYLISCATSELYSHVHVYHTLISEILTSEHTVRTVYSLVKEIHVQYCSQFNGTFSIMYPHDVSFGSKLTLNVPNCIYSIQLKISKILSTEL